MRDLLLKYSNISKGGREGPRTLIALGQPKHRVGFLMDGTIKVGLWSFTSQIPVHFVSD